jgi:hypothetical protein
MIKIDLSRYQENLEIGQVLRGKLNSNSKVLTDIVSDELNKKQAVFDFIGEYIEKYRVYVETLRRLRDRSKSSYY